MSSFKPHRKKQKLRSPISYSDFFDIVPVDEEEERLLENAMPWWYVGGKNNAVDERNKPRLVFTDRRVEATGNADWTIRVCIERKDCTDGADKDQTTGVLYKEYLLHKAALSKGPRRCEYFAGMFRHEYAESGSNATTLTLPEPAARAFDRFAGYLYGRPDRPAHSIDGYAAVPLAYLANFLDNPGLQRDIFRFIEDELWPRRGAAERDAAKVAGSFKKYLQQATELGVSCDCVRDLVVGCAVDLVHDGMRTGQNQHLEIFKTTESSFWIRVLDEIASRSKACGYDIPCVPNNYVVLFLDLCTHYETSVSLAQFEHLAEFLSAGIANCRKRSAVVGLLSVEERLRGGTKADGTATEFQRRCLAAMIEWDCKLSSVDGFPQFVVDRPVLAAALFGKIAARSEK